MKKKSKREQLLERQYVAGYRKKPEEEAEMKFLFKASLLSFTKEIWEES